MRARQRRHRWPRSAGLEGADPGDPDGLARAAAAAGVDLVVVGPEAPLVAGAADALAAAGVRCFGPGRAAARLEGSKAFAKEVMAAAGVPTAAHRVVETVEDGLDAVDGYPAVIKADGLAAGKGVVIAADEAEARGALEAMLVERRFGNHPVVVEEFLDGDELSLLALCDGERAVPLAPARDFKRIGDGDTGPNTGGMGAYSPVAEIGDALVARLAADVHQPVVDELARRGTPLHGVLYAGLMLTAAGPQGARVQRPLRRPRDPGGAPAPALGPAGAARGRHRARRPGRGRARVGPARLRVRRARLRRLPGELVVGRRHPRPRRRPGWCGGRCTRARPGSGATSSPPAAAS